MKSDPVGQVPCHSCTAWSRTPLCTREDCVQIGVWVERGAAVSCAPNSPDLGMALICIPQDGVVGGSEPVKEEETARSRKL